MGPQGDLPLVELVEHYLEHRRHDLAKGSLVVLRAVHSTIAQTRHAHTLLSEVTRAVIHEVRDDFLASGMAASTVNVRMQHVARAMDWARDRGLADLDTPRLKPLRERRTKKRPFTDAEVAAVLEDVRAVEPHWLPLVSALAYTSARSSEVRCLRDRDVDRERCEVTIEHSKTGVPRVVAIPPEVVDMLPLPGSPLGFLFPSPFDPSKPIAPKTPLLVLRRSLERLAIEDRELLDVHSFRRSWITTAHRAGIPMAVSMQQTGHSDAQVHLDYQRRAAPSQDVHAAVARVYAARVAASETWPEPGPETTETNPGEKLSARADNLQPEFSEGAPGRSGPSRRRTKDESQQRPESGLLRSRPRPAQGVARTPEDALGVLLEVAEDPQAWDRLRELLLRLKAAEDGQA